VFKTESKGWGVRTWDTILPGALICDYTGLLRRTVEVEGLLENTYIFDIDCLQTIKGLDGREVPIEISLHIRFNGWYGAWAFAHAHPEYLPFSH
jgi:[histone H3]-lysine9 N-trimethyltransferase EHMT